MSDQGASQNTPSSSKRFSFKKAAKATFWFITRVLRSGLGILFFLLFLAVFLIQLSFIQTLVFERYLEYASPQMNFRLEVGKLYLNLFNGSLHLRELSVRDDKDEVLIYAGKLNLDFDYSNLWSNHTLNFRRVELYGATLNLIQDTGDDKLNIVTFVNGIQDLFKPKKPRTQASKPVEVKFGSVYIRDTFFGFWNRNKPPKTNPGINFNHFGLDALNADVENLRIYRDTVQMWVTSLSGTEPYENFRIHQFQSKFLYCSQSMVLHGLFARAENSILGDSLRLDYESPADLGDFFNSVRLEADLDSSILHTEDLRYFSPGLSQFDDVWRVSGHFQGQVSDLKFDNLDLYFGETSHLSGAGELIGLPDITNTFLQLDFQESHFVAQELSPYIPQKDVIEVLQRFGRIGFRGSFTGFVSDFVAHGNFATDIGRIQTDLNLKLQADRDKSVYKGQLRTQDLDVGRLIEQLPFIGMLNMEGGIEGVGFNPERGLFTMHVDVGSIEIENYTYRDLRIDGELSKQRFSGSLLSKDVNFDVEVDGEMDFNLHPKHPRGRLDLKADIRKVDLQALNLVKDPIVLGGLIQADTYGLSLDSISGDVSVRDGFFEIDQKRLNIDYIDLLSFNQKKGGRYFQLHSEFLDFQLLGNYSFSRISQDLENLVNEYIMILQNDNEVLEAYYQKKKETEGEEYESTFNVHFKNLAPPLSLFADTRTFYISPGAIVEGVFSNGSTQNLSFSSRQAIDSISIYDNQFKDITLWFNSVKVPDSSNVFVNARLESSYQKIGSFQGENLSLDATWGGSLINFDGRIERVNSPNYAHVKGNVQFSKDSTLVHFEPSDFLILDEAWEINKDNIVRFTKLGMQVEDLMLYQVSNPSSSVSLNGYLSDSIAKPLNLSVHNFELLNLDGFFKTDLSGVLNMEVRYETVEKKPFIFGTINLENLVYKKVLIGDLDGTSEWEQEDQKLISDLTLYRRGRYILDIQGFYAPLKEQNPLQLIAKLDHTDLEILEPFVSGLASDLKGYAQGKLNIVGDLQGPEIFGDLDLRQGGFRLDYLNTFYTVEGTLHFDAGEISGNNLILMDKRENPALVQVGAYHDGFKDFYLDLSARFFDFNLLNTTAEDNTLFYGQAYASGDLKIQGFLNRLVMDITAQSKRGTKISLPLDGYEEVNARDYIQFVKKDGSNLDSLLVQKIELGGVEVNFNLDVTPDAEFEIIFDQKAGDIVRGNGEGNIRMSVNTNGDFNIFGYYTIQKGRYNFTFYNLVNKGFNIKPGSRITFNGDVYASQLDINAIYSRNVTLKPLVDLETVPDPESPEYRRSYEVSALLDLKGDFLNPEIKLGLDLSEAQKTSNSYLQTAVYQLQNKIETDDQERNRQVFSLLILNQISPLNSFRGSGVGNTAGSSLSELLSNQFSNWISQVDENLDLSFDVDPNNLNSFQLRVSYSLLDGRLRISRDGGFTNVENQADFASIIGDWTVEYLLTPGGRYRIKMYNRTNQNTINNVNVDNTTTTTAGFSFLYTANFNNFGEFFQSRNKREEAIKRSLRENSYQDDAASISFIPENGDSTQQNPLIPNQDFLNPSRASTQGSLKLPYRFDPITLPSKDSISGGKPVKQPVLAPSNNVPTPLKKPSNNKPLPLPGTEIQPKLPLPHRFDPIHRIK